MHLVFQGCGEEEEGEDAPWQFGHSRGRVESPEEEKEIVKSQIIAIDGYFFISFLFLYRLV